MSWEEILKEDSIDIVKTFWHEANEALGELTLSFTKLDTTINQEDKLMYQAEMSDIATHILDLTKTLGSLYRGFKRQEDGT
mgnify:CR=1 FL=1|jgi:hypothetical protein|tara:strand:+ start:670 stop:912 length:243 start_codon:yes stop_codon:yes gene_type:complete